MLALPEESELCYVVNVKVKGVGRIIISSIPATDPPIFRRRCKKACHSPKHQFSQQSANTKHYVSMCTRDAPITIIIQFPEFSMTIQNFDDKT